VQIATPLTVSAGNWVSNAIDCANTPILRLITPANWAGVGVPISFELSEEGLNFYELWHVDEGPAGYIPHRVTARIGANASVTMPPNTGHGLSWLRFKIGTPQNADMVFGIVQEAAVDQGLPAA
jgi:hypothetical protein